jgi:hypothetical protein
LYPLEGTFVGSSYYCTIFCGAFLIVDGVFIDVTLEGVLVFLSIGLIAQAF